MIDKNILILGIGQIEQSVVGDRPKKALKCSREADGKQSTQDDVLVVEKPKTLRHRARL